jgi:REP element-mobilizing transposase RayT
LAVPSTAVQVLTSAGFQRGRQAWFCRILLLMPDHLHAIVAFPGSASMKQVVGDWKRFLARRAGIRWQRDFFDHRLRDHHQTTETLAYIRMNPVRRGLVASPDQWPWVFESSDREAPWSRHLP